MENPDVDWAGLADTRYFLLVNIFTTIIFQDKPGHQLTAQKLLEHIRYSRTGTR